MESINFKLEHQAKKEIKLIFDQKMANTEKADYEIRRGINQARNKFTPSSRKSMQTLQASKDQLTL